MRRLLAAAVAALALAGCSTAANPPHHTTSPKPSPSPSVSVVPAMWGYRHQGVGPAVLATGFPAAHRTFTVRLTCVGKGPTQVRSTAGGLILGTGGCAYGVVYEAYGPRTAKRNPASIQIKVEPGVHWAVEVWAGKYVTPPTTA
jgi:hypothetical protein